MLSGVTVEDPSSTYVESGVQVGQDSVLRPGTVLRGATVIGEGCEIGPNTFIRDSTVGDGCLVLASWLESAVMESGSRIGPMSRLRAGAHLLSGAHVGNFGEVKNATIGSDVQMHHFSYIGDATVGTATNIGAGAITMNYDGKAKHHTEIGERAFIGCDTLLRAPIVVGADAATGAGSVVTQDVPPGTLVVGMPARIRRRTQVGGDAPSLPVNGAGSNDNSGVDRHEETE
jgi:bifunctional UDP-N-acetylglucosamine pyrophosphorylase/glucosamine-1-phosphate N-acetyltransferase